MTRADDDARRLPALLLRLLPLLSGACALTAPPAEQVLAEAPDDARIGAAIAAFREAPDDVAQALQTARLLFEAADLTVQRALVDAAAALEAASPSDVLAAEDELPDGIRERVLGLADTGAEAARAAIAALAGGAEGPVDAEVEANVLLAQHLSFVAWANGPMRALMAGYGSSIREAMDRALRLDPGWNHGAPLRAKGRFLAEAPWPVRDRDEALALLQRALTARAMPIHHLFLGDLLFERGDRDAALAQWRAALTSEPDATTAAVAPWHRRMARLRLAAAGERAAGRPDPLR